MNGIDRLVFTGGIGEASDELRGRILEGLSFLQIPSTVVVPTNENEVIFSHVKALL
jgi:acetate kinase